jgi:hypothetical protein
MRILLYSVLIVFCLIGCKGEEERYNECKDYEHQLQQERNLLFNEYSKLKNIYTDARDLKDTIIMDSTIKYFLDKEEQLRLIQWKIWAVRDSCHNITCILKNKQ